MSQVKRANHAVYDLKYHFVWVPKYRKRILNENIAKRVEEVFRGIAETYEFKIEAMAVVEDHVHVFLSAPPKYAPGEIVRVLKSRSATMVFKEFPQVRRELWTGGLWSDGYFVRSIGDQVTIEIIERYIEYHNSRQLAFDF
jgi:putative transposase